MIKMRANKIALIALSVLALVGLSFSYGGTSNAAVLKTEQASIIIAEQSSSSAGYYAAELADPFTHVDADFTVPTLSCSSEYAGYKVDHYVELYETYGAGIISQYQAGIDEFCNAEGRAGYNDWYGGQDADNDQGGVQHGVEPGDLLIASVTSLSGNRMEFEVSDLTHPGDSFSINAPGLLSVAPVFNRAAVFTEAYGIDLYGPPDFRSVKFSDIEISDTAGSGTFTSRGWVTYEDILDGYSVGKHLQVNVQPSPLSDGDAFTNDWLQYSYHD